MALSGRELKAKENTHELSEGLPIEMLMPKALLSLIGEYLDGEILIPASFYANGQRLTFFNQDLSDYKQAIKIAHDHVLPAGPLDQLEAKVKENPHVLLPTLRIKGMEGTLVQLAMFGLDHTLGKNVGTAETLLNLQAILLPDTMPEALEQAKSASLFEEKDEKRAIEHKKVLDDAFNNIKDNKPNVGVIIKKYIESTKPTVIINNGFALSVLQLLCRACDLLATKGGELSGGWYGAQVRRFCIEVIGGIEAEFCILSRLMQILMSGVYQFIYQNQKAERLIDRDGSKFLGGTGACAILGVKDFYDDFGLGGAAGGPAVANWRPSFQSLFRAITTASKTYAVALHSIEERVSDSVVGFQSNPAASMPGR